MDMGGVGWSCYVRAPNKRKMDTPNYYALHGISQDGRDTEDRYHALDFKKTWERDYRLNLLHLHVRVAVHVSVAVHVKTFECIIVLLPVQVCTINC